MRLASQSDRAMISFCLLWALMITALRGFQWPNDWAEAQWMVTYDLGFMKRALPGTVLSFFYSEGSPGEHIARLIRVGSTAVLVVFFAVLYWVLQRIARRCSYSLDGVLVSLAFATSPFVVSSANLNGYFDGLFGLLIFLALVLTLQRRIWAAAVVLVLGLLTHETTMLLGLPIVVFAAVLVYRRKSPLSVNSFSAVWGLLRFLRPLLLPVVAFGAFLLHQFFFFRDAEILRSTLHEHLSRFDFIEYNADKNLAKSYALSVRSFFHREARYFVGRITDLQCLVLILPTLFVVLAYAGRLLGGVRRANSYILLMVSISVLPLALHFVAFDTFRIWTYPLIVGLLFAWVLGETVQPTEQREPVLSTLGLCSFAVTVMNVFLISPIFNKEDTFPLNEVRVVLYAPALAVIPILYRRLILARP